MATLKNFSESILAIWHDSTPAARIGLALLTLLCVVVIGLVGYWSAQAKFVTLISEIDHEKMASIVDALDKAGIKYEVGGAGGVLRVDERQFAKARLIARAQGVSADATETEMGAAGMWLDPTDRRNLENKKRESTLESSIKKYKAVQSADVHLNVPAKGPFERTVSKPSASVLLTLTPNEQLSDENVLAIASLVAYAVQDLEPEAVRISDKDGKVYAVPDETSGSFNGQIEFTTQYERKLARKAETQLTQFLGLGNASVQVSLDMTFKQSNSRVLDIDPDGKVATLEDLSTETTTKQGTAADGTGAGAAIGAPAGTAGVASNLGNQGAAQIQGKTETIKSTYIVPQTEKTEINNTPIRNFMTVSVLVNSLAPAVVQEDGTLNADMQNRVEQIVRTAVGFQEGPDTIWVEFQPFPVADPTESVSPPFDWVHVNEILRNVSLALAALVAMVFGYMTLKRFSKPTTSSKPVVIAGQQAANISQLNDLARTNPEVFTRILQSWAGSNRDAGDSGSRSNQNAA